MRNLGLFDRCALKIKPLSLRRHGLGISAIRRLNTGVKPYAGLKKAAQRIIQARQRHACVIFMMGGHVVRAGVQKYIIDLMERGYLSAIAMNGSGMIHDFEFAMIGATTESVSRYIKEGEFGLWQETARLNDIINTAYKKDKNTGMGEAVGEYLENSSFPYKSVSIIAAAYRLNIPLTVHVGIGCDIIHEHPNCDGAATGALSYNDFLRFVSVVQGLENGVVMNFGSAVMAPEVFLKALSMARNVARRRKRDIRHFTTLVCDLIRLSRNIKQEPARSQPQYYFRPWKTMLVRTVADGGEGFYVRGKHSDTICGLWQEIRKLEGKKWAN